MEDWKKSLDRYLTTEPSSDFDDWCEKVIDKFSFAFWNSQEVWIDEYDGQCNKWLNKLYQKQYEPQKAAEIIEKAFKIYV